MPEPESSQAPEQKSTSSSFKSDTLFYRPTIDPPPLPYDPFKASVVPRPIGWISTRNPTTGIANLAPYSQFNNLTYDQVIERKLAVMDTAAIALCRDHKVPLRIYDMSRDGDLMRIIQGEPIGTLVS